MLGGVFHLHEQQAREVMTPIPAVVTVDASETVEAALRRCVSSGHTRLRRDRGRQPRPRQGHRPQQQPRPALHERRPRGLDRAGDPRRADRPRDEAARRPARRSCSASAPRSRSSSTSTGARSGSSPSRTSSRRSSARSRTRPTPARRRCASSPTATGSCAATSRSATSTTPASSCRSTPTPTTRSAATSSPSSGGCRSAATRSRADGYTIRVESVRENRIEALRIRDRRTESCPSAIV